MSLARSECDRVVSSIFVNPAQFAPHEDLDKYPRTLQSDVEMLSSAGVDVVLAPTVREMYPAGITLHVDGQKGTFVEVLGMSHQLEGTIRPHFFRGVATVVTKLLNIAGPTSAYFGQKDGQQCAVVRTLVRDLHMPVRVVVCPTVRESDGLAMSSRNRYLLPDERKLAPVLYRALLAAERTFKDAASGGDGAATTGALMKASALEVLEGVPGIRVEYVSVADSLTLAEVDGPLLGTGGSSGGSGPEEVMISGAIRVGSTRLIDNLLLRVVAP
ncbi:pantothenate synthase [Cladochytrium tenue]|nr:pantothenate synthase [Cladochytrium tenue]